MIEHALIGRMIGGYRILRRIGQGGMGTVYEAVDTRLGRRVAVKTLRQSLIADSTAVARFFNEAKAIGMVSHPCLVTIYEHGIFARQDGGDDEAYIVMEYIEGESLRARLDTQYLGQSALELVRQLASALAMTHKQGIVHRDLKPDNIMLLADDTVRGGVRVKLLDFGLAKLLPRDEASYPPRAVKTRTGVLIGTPMYMSPEQCRGSNPADAKTDVYALGIILYELLYGEPPFVSDAPGELYAMHLFALVHEITSLVPSLSPQLARLVHRMIEKRPAARPNMDELLVELQALTETGLVDGAVALRPSAQRGDGKPGVAAGLSDQIRRQLQGRVAGMISLGDQATIATAPRSRSFGRLIAAAAMFLVVLGGLILIFRFRGASVSPRPVAASTAKALPPVAVSATPAPMNTVSAKPAGSAVPSRAPVRETPPQKSKSGVRHAKGYDVRAWQ